MKKTIILILLYFCACLLIPCLVTLAIGDMDKKTIASLATVNEEAREQDVEDFVIRAVATYYEEGDSADFLRALAIVMRTYGEISSKTDNKLQILTYTELRAKWGEYYSSNYEAVVAAVADTEGIVMESETVEVLPYFCEISAGYTRGKENTCLAMANCSDDLQSSEYMSVVSYNDSQLNSMLKEKYPELKFEGKISESFQVISRDEAGYVDNLMIGNLTISGDELAKVLSLNSGNFMVTSNDDGMIFTVKGVGDGYGMSLYTARAKANKGAGYREILFYFYKNITLSE